MRSRRLAQSSYSTRTQTGSVKRKHYDHMSDSDRETAPKLAIVRRRVVASSNSVPTPQPPSPEVETHPASSSVVDDAAPMTSPVEPVGLVQNHFVESKASVGSDSGTETDIYSDSGNETQQSSKPQTTSTVAESVRSSPRKVVVMRARVNTGRLLNGGAPESTRPRRSAAYGRQYRDSDDDDVTNEHSYGIRPPRPQTNGRTLRARACAEQRQNDSDESDTEVDAARSWTVSSRGRIRKVRNFFDDS